MMQATPQQAPYNRQQFLKAYDTRLNPDSGKPAVQQPYQPTPPNLGGGQWWQRGQQHLPNMPQQQLPNMPPNYGYTPGPIPYAKFVQQMQAKQQQQAMGLGPISGGTGNAQSNPFMQMLNQQRLMQQQAQNFTQRAQPQMPPQQQNPYLPRPMQHPAFMPMSFGG
jgi:hypothetical protein